MQTQRQTKLARKSLIEISDTFTFDHSVNLQSRDLLIRVKNYYSFHATIIKFADILKLINKDKI